jgi:hypothetical protein
MMMRRRGPGLVGTMARTAVIAGTASAVSGAVTHKQQEKAAAQQAQAQAHDQAVYDAGVAAAQQAAAAPATAPAPAAAPAGGEDLMAQLKQLGDLKAAGVLTEEEFAAAKAKLLA